MSAPAAVLGDGTTARSRAAARWRRARPAVLVLALLPVVTVAGVLALPRTSGGALDPGSAVPQGARAVAQVLGDQGVEVVRVDSVADAVAAAAGSPGTAAAGGQRAGATIVVVDPQVLPPDRLEALAATAADLVVVEPDGPVLDVLAPGVRPAGVVEARTRPADCAAPAAVAAGQALAGGRLLRAAGADADVCFPDAEDPAAGSYLRLAGDGRTVHLLGQGGVLANEHLAADGNAALALHVLGGHDRLVWLMASPLDTGADEDVTAVDLLPGWVGPVTGWLAVTAALAMLWRGRRLGRLVPEPLPVVVRSAETAEGRASLYRAAGARDRAAAVLRAATLRRLAVRLGLPVGAATDATDAVVAAVARASGRPEGEVAALLTGPPPADDRALTALADDLDALSADVTTRPTREGPPR